MSELIETSLWLLGTGIGCALSWRFILWAKERLDNLSP
jgi:hypothetical protein